MEEKRNKTIFDNLEVYERPGYFCGKPISSRAKKSKRFFEGVERRKNAALRRMLLEYIKEQLKNK